MILAAMAIQGADVAPTASQAAACATARTQASVLMARWKDLETKGVAALNTRRKAAGEAEVRVPN